MFRALSFVFVEWLLLDFCWFLYLKCKGGNE